MPCLNLSQTDLNSLLSQGWQLDGGPFLTEAECLAICQGSSTSSESSESSSSSTGGCCDNCNVINCPCNGCFVFTISGVTNDDCALCELVNRTWTLEIFDPILFPCYWVSTESFTFCDDQIDPPNNIVAWDLICMSFDPFEESTPPQWFLRFSHTSATTVVWYELGINNPLNCQGDNTFTLFFETFPDCASWPATITISMCPCYSCTKCITFSISGITNNNCENCLFLNGNFKLVGPRTFQGGGDSWCFWQDENGVVPACTGENDQYPWALTYYTSGTFAGQAFLFALGTEIGSSFENLDFDCSPGATNIFTLQEPMSTFDCEWLSAPATIVTTNSCGSSSSSNSSGSSSQ
jgi:hypothetical protein